MQDRAITEIGKLELSNRTDIKPYQLYVQEITPGNVCFMALIIFEKREEELHYKHVDIDKVNVDNYQRYGYRKGSPRGGDVTFTTKFGDLDKKFGVLLNTQWPSLLEIAKDIPEEYKLFKEWKNAFEQNQDQIQKDLATFHAGLDKKEQQKSAFTLVLESDGRKSLLVDYKSVQKQILLSGTDGKKNKYNVTSVGQNNTCSICGFQKDTLYGFASPFKYATVDKPGTVSGFFNQKNNWINYPICEDCALEFELGKNYIQKYLSRSFFGKRYFLIPKTILPDDKANLKKALNLFKELTYQAGSDEKKKDIERREDYLMEQIGGLENFFTLDLLFYEENPTTKAIKIKLMLEEIPPSRFRTLFIEVPNSINNHPLYLNADYNFNAKEKVDLRFGFGLIKQFFEDSFYDIIYKVFQGQNLNRADLLSRFMDVIRKNHNKRMTDDGFVEDSSLILLKAHLVLRYLEKLNVVITPNYTIMIPETEEEKKESSNVGHELLENLKSFLNRNKEFIYANHIAGIFSIGVLIRLVLDKQYIELKNTPFEKKLKGLNLSAKDIQKIFLEGLDKLNQYFSVYKYQELREYVTDNFSINFTEVKKMTNQEISFYFVSGLELGRKFKPEKKAQNQS